jgi:hypothetical protein
MQKIYPRTNPTPFGPLKNSNAKKRTNTKRNLRLSAAQPIATGSTKGIADHIVHWKEAVHSTALPMDKRSAETERAKVPSLVLVTSP